MPMTLNYMGIAHLMHQFERMSKCIDEIVVWMQTNQMKLNSSKTEVI